MTTPQMDALAVNKKTLIYVGSLRARCGFMAPSRSASPPRWSRMC